METRWSTRAQDGWTVVAMTAELDIATAPALREHLTGVLSRGEDLVLDLSETPFMDSSGLGALVLTARNARLLDRQVLLVPSLQVRRVLKITHVEPLFTTIDSLEEALPAR